MRGDMRIVVDFKGNLIDYRNNVGPKEIAACQTYYDKISAMNAGFTWRDVVDTHFCIHVNDLDAAAIWEKVKVALGEYQKAAQRIDLDSERTEAMWANDEGLDDAHSCVQWVFSEGKWTAIYNYNLWVHNEKPKDPLRTLKIETSPSLSVKYRAVVSFTLPR